MKELNTLATPAPDKELDADETLGSNENTLEEPTAQSDENDNPQTEENNTENIQTDENPQTEEKDEYDEVWNKDLNEVDLTELSEEPTEQETSEEQKQIEEPIEEKNEDTNVGSEEEKNNEPQGLVITKPLKYRGKEIWVRTEDEAIELMQKGLDYSFKMNKIKPLRNIASIIEEAGITPEDVKALADAKNGKAEAIKYLANKFGIELESEDDIFSEEEPTSTNYKPEVQEEDPIKEFYTDLTQRDPELAGKVSKIWDTIDDTFKVELYKPDVFPAFVGSVQTGEFEQVLPEAVKIKALNPALSWLQAYQYASQNISPVQRQVSEPTDTVKPKKTVKTKRKRKTIEETYDEIWNSKSLEELEKELFN